MTDKKKSVASKIKKFVKKAGRSNEAAVLQAEKAVRGVLAKKTKAPKRKPKTGPINKATKKRK